jgi:hypothetical protein
MFVSRHQSGEKDHHVNIVNISFDNSTKLRYLETNYKIEIAFMKKLRGSYIFKMFVII